MRGTCLRPLTAHVLHRPWSTRVFHSKVLEAGSLFPLCAPAPQPTLSFLFLSLPLLQRAQRLALINPSFVLRNQTGALFSENNHLNLTPRATKARGKARQPELWWTLRCLSAHMLKSCGFRLRDVPRRAREHVVMIQANLRIINSDPEPKNSSIWKWSVLSGRAKLGNFSRHLPDICKVEYVNVGPAVVWLPGAAVKLKKILLS